MNRLDEIRDEILACRRCARLVQWREKAAREPPKRYVGQSYHARAVPGWGDPRARVLVVGLAPAAHGANRTGRMFTGDKSGEWLYRALHKTGFANQPESVSASDGLRLQDVYITAACRCAPPENKPTPDEIWACAGYLDREMDLLWPCLRVIVPLGAIALGATLDALRRRRIALPRPAPAFGHLALARPGGAPAILMSYHPSQQNTLTGVLTEPMFDGVWSGVRDLLGESAGIR